MIFDILLFVIATLGVTKAADWFLASSEKVGLFLRLPSFILGVLLVGFGTSLPELTTAIASVINREAYIVIPNIMGSNIANVLLIIGLASVVLGTIKFEKNLIDLDLPVLLTTSVLFGLLVIDGTLSRLDGVLLLISFVGYVVYSLYYTDSDEYHHGLMGLVVALSKNKRHLQVVERQRPRARTYLLLILSVLLLGLLSKVAVDSLLAVVESVNISVGVLSYFALAIGTSLPELVVSIKALKQGKGDVVLGNVIGSSMFNILLVGGLSSVLAVQSVALPTGLWMTAGLVISALVLFASGITRRIHIWEGASFVLVYIAIAFHITT